MGVAISTTGHEHRMGFLETCVRRWSRVLTSTASIFVTVDGSEDDLRRVRALVGKYTYGVYRVGQLEPGWGVGPIETGRLGVAANKNTGLELLMDQTGAEHLFLSDDDCYPKYPQSLTKHTDLGYGHSLVGWGKSRLDAERSNTVSWTWPRGVMLYMHRDVVRNVGGMIEEFGLGGNEHVEYSRRIHQAGYTPEPYISPLSYGTRNCQGAAAMWHCEDMAQPGEPHGTLGSRRRKITSITHKRNWGEIHALMDERDGDTSFVPYRAAENGRASATLCADTTSRGADT